MIYGLLQTVQEDIQVLQHWIKKEKIPNLKEEDQEHRIQVATARMFAGIAMAFGGLWTFSLLTFIIGIPVKIALNLAMAVGLYALAHDVFVMSHNAVRPEFQKGLQAKLMELFKGNEVREKERACQFTQGTFLQPVWMWLYVHRHDKVIPLF